MATIPEYPTITGDIADVDARVRSLELRANLPTDLASRVTALEQPPEMSHYASGTFSLPTGAWTKLSWAGIIYSSPTVSGVLGSATAGITAVAGRYQVEGSCAFPSGGGSRRGIWVGPTSISVPDYRTFGQLIIPPVSGAGTILTTAGTLWLTAADVITLFIYQDSGAAITVDATTARLNVRRISTAY